jgi:hypothetical protein
VLLIFIVLFIQSYRKYSTYVNDLHPSFNKNNNSFRYIFASPNSCTTETSNLIINNKQNYSVAISDTDDDDLIWSNDTIELFQDQLGLTLLDNNDNGSSSDYIKCHVGKEFLLSALPGPDEKNFNEVLWQYFSMDALERTTMICDGNKKLFLRAAITERMKSHLNQIFEG